MNKFLLATILFFALTKFSNSQIASSPLIGVISEIDVPTSSKSTIDSKKLNSASISYDVTYNIKIINLLSIPTGNEFRIYGAMNAKPFCKNSTGGSGQQPMAYIDLNDSFSKYSVAVLMQAFQENKPVSIVAFSVVHSPGTTICKIHHFVVS
jgi:hypothetical protein